MVQYLITIIVDLILTYDDTDKEEVIRTGQEGGFPYTSGGNRVNTTAVRQSDKNSGYGFDVNTRSEYADSGSASRYFYCAKASRKDRDEGLEYLEYYALNEDIDEKIKKHIKRLLNQ